MQMHWSTVHYMTSSQIVKTEKLEKYFPLAIVMCDINGLKEINDQKGHDAGDKFIVQTAQTLKSVFGKRHVYRFGGDEFIAVLPNITHPAFQKLLETAKSQLGATASLGTTISGTKDTDFESLLKAADMYVAVKKAIQQKYPFFDASFYDLLFK